MSADNWAVCPRCKALRRAAARAARVKVQESYGSVSVEDFDALRVEADRLSALVDAPGEGQTFREDYEITGAEDGEVSVTYSGGCAVCGLALSFDHSHRLAVRATDG